MFGFLKKKLSDVISKFTEKAKEPETKEAKEQPQEAPEEQKREAKELRREQQETAAVVKAEIRGKATEEKEKLTFLQPPNPIP